MANVVIATFGTRGDVVPLTGVGHRLQQAGHRVVLAAPAELTDLITGCGLRARPMDFEFDFGGDVDLTDVDPRKVAMRFLSPRGIRAMGAGLLSALQDEPADVLLLSPFAELAGHPLAEAREIPSIGLRLQPLSTTGDQPPAILGAWSAGRTLNRMAGRLAAATIDRVYAGVVADFRHTLGLPRMSARRLRRRRTEAEWPILHGYSPAVVPRPADWRPGLDVVGYWWPRRATGWRPPAELLDFLDAGPPPVFLSFGSLVMTRAESARLCELVPLALRTAGVRGLIQAGWAALDIRTDDVRTFGDIPHDWLFDRVAAVVHACGAGTTAAGLRAGLPAVAIPEPGGDQPFWARRLHTLGVSAATLSRRRLTADRLAHAIRTACTDPHLHDNAKRVAARISTEDGAGQVRTAVEKLLR
jgi:sterol 3beta-glucosyltransferase